MARTVDVFQIDAFTHTPFTGNPAGVVLDADGLEDAQMLAIARELNNADTAFVLSATAPDHDIRVRFFTPRTEAAFVGHATIAVHAVLARLAPRSVCRQAGKSGIVEVTSLPGDEGFSIRQAPAPLGRALTGGEIDTVLGALGLARTALDPRCPPRIAGGASTRLLLGLGDGRSLAGLAPDLATLGKLSAVLGCAGYFLFSLTPTTAASDVESRMFCPALGIPEDPVSGNAHGMLGVYLWSLGLLDVRSGQAQFTGAQGHHLGRAGRVAIALDINSQQQCSAVHIRGQAVQIFRTQITL